MKTMIDLFLRYLPQLIQAGKSIPDIKAFIDETKETLKQEKEWTEEQEAEFTRKVEAVTSAPHWQPKS